MKTVTDQALELSRFGDGYLARNPAVINHGDRLQFTVL